MTPFIAEYLGTAIILAFGNGVVANVLLKGSKGNNGGWIVITFGWAMGVFIGVYATAAVSGAHLNPAVTIALAVKGDFPWQTVPAYILAQVCGAATGALIAWLAYKQHFDAHGESAHKLAVFSTIPSIRHPLYNLLTEMVATFIFILGVLFISKPTSTLGSLDALPVAFLVLAIGLSYGGPTGYAINPARDLGPRIMHAILPIQGKGSSDWSYAWVPILGPVLGALIAVAVFAIIT
ncbi:MAG: aquaporin family protein [Chitinophagaceae bacterium]|jgi:glycerol uptake facilitator protein|nr:aquaporin family protein [Chitinophagaceae bacterium]